MRLGSVDGCGWYAPEPMTLGDARVATDGVVLIRYPHNQYDVEGRRGVVEEFRHDGLHSCSRERARDSTWLMAKQIN